MDPLGYTSLFIERWAIPVRIMMIAAVQILENLADNEVDNALNIGVV